MTISGKGLAVGSVHILRGGSSEKPFEWTGKSWSTPGTGWGTKPSGMAVLGWSYVRADTSK